MSEFGKASPVFLSPDTCRTCGGEGQTIDDPRAKATRCPDCDGSGRLSITHPPIPKSLAEAVQALDCLLDEADLQTILTADNRERMLVSLHHSLGQYLRNEWRLWSGPLAPSPLVLELQRLGHDHPDDMSHHILRHYVESKIPTVWDRITKEEV